MSKTNELLKTQLIIKSLNTKAKINIKKIIKNMNISRQSFYNKFDDLRKNQIINNYTININPNPPINLKYILLEIKTNPKEPHLVEELIKFPQLMMLDGIFGEFSLIGLFVFKSSEEYYQILKSIDNIMAKSYFKKYQVIDIIKAFKINGIILNNEIITLKRDLDQIDYLILEILQKKQKGKPLSTYNIKQVLQSEYNIEISQPTVYYRIKDLEASNVILNYTINFNPRKIGFNGKYIVRIKPKNPSKYGEIAAILSKNRAITDLFRIGEQYGLLALIRVEKVEYYGKFIKELYDTEEIEDTWTNFILDELKSHTNFVFHSF